MDRTGRTNPTNPSVLVVTVDDVLSHHGIKGMKWGVRRAGDSGGSSGSSHQPAQTHMTPGHRVRASGGTHAPAHEDAVQVAKARQTARKSTTDALSTSELRKLVDRMNLEQQYSRLQPPTTGSKVAKFLADTLLQIGKQQIQKAASDYASKQIGEVLKNVGKKAVTEAVTQATSG